MRSQRGRKTHLPAIRARLRADTAASVLPCIIGIWVKQGIRNMVDGRRKRPIVADTFVPGPEAKATESKITKQMSAEPDFDALLQHIQQSRGVDFRGYKRTSLKRRIALRMEAVG